jgi:hypothetical protein
MRISFAATAIALAALATAAPAQTALENFDAASEWTVEGNDITTNGATASAADNTADKTQGAGAVAFTWNYSGNQYYEAAILKTFASPMDLTGIEAFSLDMKGDAAAAADLIWYMTLIDGHGRKLKAYFPEDAPNSFAGIHTLGTNWQRYNFNVGNFVWDTWGNPTGHGPDLTDIVKIRIGFQTPATVTASSSTILIDNFASYADSPSVSSTLIEGFEYADNAAFLAEWDTHFSGGPNTESTSTVSLATTGAYAGSGAFQIAGNFADGAQWWSTGQKMTFAAPQDFSGYDAFKVAVSGTDSMPAGAAPNVLVYLQDAAGNRALWIGTESLQSAAWSRLFLLPPSTWAGSLPMKQDAWDAQPTVDLDMATISAIQIALIPNAANGGGVYPYSLTAKVDDFQAITSTALPFISDPFASSVENWDLY